MTVLLTMMLFGEQSKVGSTKEAIASSDNCRSNRVEWTLEHDRFRREMKQLIRVTTTIDLLNDLETVLPRNTSNLHERVREIRLLNEFDRTNMRDVVLELKLRVRSLYHRVVNTSSRGRVQGLPSARECQLCRECDQTKCNHSTDPRCYCESCALVSSRHVVNGSIAPTWYIDCCMIGC